MRFGAGGTWAAEKAARPVGTMLQAAVIAVPLGGCWINGKPPEPGLDIPAAYSAGPKKPLVADAATAVARLVARFPLARTDRDHREARDANLDIAAAVARIVQADAQSRIAGAALLPQVDLDGGATRSRASQSTSGTSGIVGGSERDTLSDLADRELRDRLLGQEPRRAARRRRDRGRQPLRPRSRRR